MPRPPVRAARRRRPVLAALLVACLTGVLAVPVPAGAVRAPHPSAHPSLDQPTPVPPAKVHPHLVRAVGAAIEPLAPYVGQDDCDPRIKRGTAELGALLTRTYPDIGWGSVRPCDGSVSEHHDGRAIDWMASIRSPHEHAEALSLLDWLLAPDAAGNPFAMARRLGVMYLIYNGRMWGAWSGQWEEYDGCLTSPTLRATRYDDTCHRSHVHISLSWNGARGRTSFWTGVARRTDYGPCVHRGHRYAAPWSGLNLQPCPPVAPPRH